MNLLPGDLVITQYKSMFVVGAEKPNKFRGTDIIWLTIVFSDEGLQQIKLSTVREWLSNKMPGEITIIRAGGIVKWWQPSQ